MPDNWSFVIAAYLLAAVVLGADWRHLGKKERELESHKRMDQPVKGPQSVGGHVNPSMSGPVNHSITGQSVKGTAVSQSVKGTAVNRSVKATEPRVPGPGHPRSESSTRRPLP